MTTLSKWLNEISVLQYVAVLYGSIAIVLCVVWIGVRISTKRAGLP